MRADAPPTQPGRSECGDIAHIDTVDIGTEGLICAVGPPETKGRPVASSHLLPAFETVIRIRYLALLLPPLATLLVDRLVASSDWGTYVFLLHAITGLYLTWVALITVSNLPLDHPSRKRIKVDLLPGGWALLIFYPLFIIADPSPGLPWEGIALATAAVANFVMHRSVLVLRWRLAFVVALMCAGLAAMAGAIQVEGGPTLAPYLFESMLLYGIYGGLASLVVVGWHELEHQS